VSWPSWSENGLAKTEDRHRAYFVQCYGSRAGFDADQRMSHFRGLPHAQTFVLICAFYSSSPRKFGRHDILKMLRRNSVRYQILCQLQESYAFAAKEFTKILFYQMAKFAMVGPLGHGHRDDRPSSVGNFYTPLVLDFSCKSLLNDTSRLP
jgi:hypothetical protein